MYLLDSGLQSFPLPPPFLSPSAREELKSLQQVPVDNLSRIVPQLNTLRTSPGYQGSSWSNSFMVLGNTGVQR